MQVYPLHILAVSLHEEVLVAMVTSLSSNSCQVGSQKFSYKLYFISAVVKDNLCVSLKVTMVTRSEQ